MENGRNTVIPLLNICYIIRRIMMIVFVGINTNLLGILTPTQSRAAYKWIKHLFDLIFVSPKAPLFLSSCQFPLNQSLWRSLLICFVFNLSKCLQVCLPRWPSSHQKRPSWYLLHVSLSLLVPTLPPPTQSLQRPPSLPNQSLSSVFANQSQTFLVQTGVVLL